jgi:methylenetetrahydrofolate reductase (NADPH)
MTSPFASPNAPIPLLGDFSLGVTGDELGELGQARAVIPPGTRVHVGFRSEDLAARWETARAVKTLGFAPVPIIPARRMTSGGMLREYLAGLRAVGATVSVVVVGGDPEQPRGPYPDAASVINSGLLEEHGVRKVSVAGHPGGHPAVTDDVLWSALAGKVAALERRGLDSSVITQFGFDPALALTWLAGLRARGVSLPVRVGVPGPTGVRRLLSYASRCGVSVSAEAARQYDGFSLTGRTGEAGPERFIRSLASGYDARLHGEVKLHFDPFGGIAALAEWLSGAS